MFGQLLGLSRRQINARFDTIAEFAEVTGRHPTAR